MSLRSVWNVRRLYGLALLGVGATFGALVGLGVFRLESVMAALIGLGVGGLVLALPWGAPPGPDAKARNG